MANLKVTLVRLCKTAEGWRRYPAAIGPKGKVKPGIVLVAGKEVHYPNGRYQLRSYEGSRMVYKDVGLHAADAVVAQKRKTNLLKLRDVSVKAGVKPPEEASDRINLQAAYERFVQAAEDRGSVVAAQHYRSGLREFLDVCKKTYADELVPEDMLIYLRALRKRGLHDRTMFDRHSEVRWFYTALGFDSKAVKILAGRAPRYEKKLVEKYTDEEIRNFFGSLTDLQFIVAFELLLKCGLRERELTNLEWTSVDLTIGVLRVRANARTGFKVKDAEERIVTIPDDLLGRLKTLRSQRPSQVLVVKGRGDKPRMALLDTLKRLVRQAGLNCGTCDGCLSPRPGCKNWWLHKFRATYITKLQASKMELRSVMALSGHSSLKSVLRYLAPAESEVIRAQVNAVKFGM
jgi:integrase